MDLAAFRVDVSDKTAWLFVRLRDDEGAEGWGEATHFGVEAEIAGLVAGLNDELRDAASRTRIAPGPEGGGENRARPGVRGRARSGADAPGDLSSSTLPNLTAPLVQSDLGPPRRALISAIEQAWLDLAARRAGLSLTVLLGGPCRARVPFYANINRGIADRSPDGFAARAKQIVAKTGASAVKIAPFDGLRWDRASPDDMARLTNAGLDRIAAVRAALPDGARLMVDCHSRFDPFHARQILSALAEQSVYWIEDPCNMAALSATEQRSLRGAANRHGLRLAGGEDVTDIGQMARLLHAGGHDVVLPDLRLTGIAEGMAMLRLAAGMGVAASLHNPVGPVLDAVSAHVAAALPSFLILERQVGETPLYDALRGGPATSDTTGIALPEGPGIGIVPEHDAMVPLKAAGEARLSRAGLTGSGPDG